MEWPQQDDLSILLNQLRAVQDPRPPSPPSIKLSAEDSQKLLLSFTSSSSSNLPASEAESSLDPTALPSQSQLDSLLESLSQPSPAETRRQLSTLSFPEALPILQGLSTNEDFIEDLIELRNYQNEEELRLKDDRNRLKDEIGRKGISPQAQLAKLKNWDRSEGLVRWEKLKEEQVLALEQMGVPTFCKTADPKILARQKRVLEILVGLLEDS